MGRRVSRLYAWHEIQELARDLQALYHEKSEETQQADVHLEEQITTAPQSSEEHHSRIVRVEQIRLERQRARLERREEVQSKTSRTLNFNAQDFKLAWKNRQKKVSAFVDTSSNRPDQSAQDHTRYHPVSTQPQSLHQISKTQCNHHVHAPTSSPWELLRDHFLEQHRLHKEQKNNT